MPRYKVMVDDNFRYQDSDERRQEGIYEMAEEALEVCRRLVDTSLKEAHRPGISADALYVAYTSFGDDPFVVVVDGEDDAAKFSTWNYAKERCPLISGELGWPSGSLSFSPFRDVRSSATGRSLDNFGLDNI